VALAAQSLGQIITCKHITSSFQ